MRAINSLNPCQLSALSSRLSASQQRSASALPLLVLLVRADHAHHAAAADHLALVTNPFDRRSHLHDTLSILADGSAFARARLHRRYGVSSPGYSPGIHATSEGGPQPSFSTIRPRVR